MDNTAWSTDIVDCHARRIGLPKRSTLRTQWPTCDGYRCRSSDRPRYR